MNSSFITSRPGLCSYKTYEPAQKISVPIAYAQISIHAYVPSGARDLNFGLSFHFYPHFLYVSSMVLTRWYLYIGFSSLC